MVEKVDVVFNYGGEWVLTPQLTYLKKMTHLWEGCRLVMKNEFMYTMHMEKFLLPLFGDATGCLTRLEHVVHVHYRETQENAVAIVRWFSSYMITEVFYVERSLHQIRMM
ncbi:uncharacterized protein LOC107863749 isoform X4 [Capsicum annuum]|uniref:uncharacterized protein LOC107863749 isoform X4 n=1 Tax=Capsicum annuum TaxID=4072 RepID=UPI001FB18F55|nr:uncharacterized protein LOC107863749 isoform X4 [Capsicum annuum]